MRYEIQFHFAGRRNTDPLIGHAKTMKAAKDLSDHLAPQSERGNLPNQVKRITVTDVINGKQSDLYNWIESAVQKAIGG